MSKIYFSYELWLEDVRNYLIEEFDIDPDNVDVNYYNAYASDKSAYETAKAVKWLVEGDE